MNRTKVIISITLAIFIVSLIGLGIWYYISYIKNRNQNFSSQNLSPTPTAQQVIDQNLPEGWISYNNPSMGYTFAYPQDANIERKTNEVTITKWGPTQKENTEFYDGLSLTIKTAPLNGDRLEQKATKLRDEAQISVAPLGGTVSDISEKDLSSRQIFTFTVDSLTQSTHYIIPRSIDMYFEAIDSTQDPTNAGYASQADKIISSLRDLNEEQN